MTSKQTTVGVIGAGYIGVCSALELRRLGHDVVLIDTGDPESAASYGNSGQFASDEVVPLAAQGVILSVPKWLMDPLGPLTIRWRDLPALTPWLLRFAAASRPSRAAAGVRAMAAMCARMHDDYAPLLDRAQARDLISDIECIKLYRQRADWERDARLWELRTQAGVQFELLNRSDLEALDPAMSAQAQFGVLIRERRYVLSPQRLRDVFTQMFVDDGGILRIGEATRLQTHGRDVVAVHMKDGDPVELDSVVIAAGIGSLALSRQLGDKVPLISERGYHLMLPAPGVDVQRAYTLAWAGMGISPMKEGLRLAGTVELASLDAPPNMARAHHLFTHANTLFPGLNREGCREWMGHRPSFPDSLPVIDRASRFDNVVYAFGHGHMGVGWAATTAKMVGALHENQPLEMDIKPYGLRRFH